MDKSSLGMVSASRDAYPVNKTSPVKLPRTASNIWQGGGGAAETDRLQPLRGAAASSAAVAALALGRIAIHGQPEARKRRRPRAAVLLSLRSGAGGPPAAAAALTPQFRQKLLQLQPLGGALLADL